MNEHDYEKTQSEISDAHADLIQRMDQDPEASFRRLERQGYKVPGRPTRPRSSEVED